MLLLRFGHGRKAPDVLRAVSCRVLKKACCQVLFAAGFAGYFCCVFLLRISSAYIPTCAFNRRPLCGLLATDGFLRNAA